MAANLFKYAICGFLLLHCVSGLSEPDWSDVDFLEFDEPDNSTKNCTDVGLMCSTCTQLSYCNMMPDGSFVQVPLIDCANGETCNSDKLQCSSEPDDFCSAIGDKFECTSVGIFPDIHDCKKYYMCAIDTAIKRYDLRCPNGFGYDIVTSSCRIKLINDTCSYSLGRCTNATVTAIEKNPAFYYSCSKVGLGFTSKVFMCSGDKQFIDKGCQTPPTGIENKLCIDKKFYYDPTDCRKYNECPAKGAAPVARVCPTNTKFSYQQQKCVEFNCNSYIGN